MDNQMDHFVPPVFPGRRISRDEKQQWVEELVNSVGGVAEMILQEELYNNVPNSIDRASIISRVNHEIYLSNRLRRLR